MSGVQHFFEQVLPPAQQQALRRLAPVASAEGFYLGGGTALAIRLGHRRSLVFDWFREHPLDQPHALAARIRAASIPFLTTQVAAETLHGMTAGVATSFFRYPYPTRTRTLHWAAYGCQLASPADIASMKLSAVTQRGARKDFVDIFALGRSGMTLAQTCAG